MLKTNIKMGISSLWASKQRSLLALLGIVIGIGSVIAMVSVGIIVKEHSLKQFLEMGTDYLVVSKGWGGGGGGKDAPKITMAQAQQMTRSIPAITESAPLGQTGSRYSYRGESYSPQVLATTENFLRVNRLEVAEGRYISDLDVNMPYCVLGQKAAQDMRDKGVEKIIGAKIKMKERLFTIIGILKKGGGGGLQPFNANKALYMPYSTYDRVFDDPEISYVLARMKQGLNPDAVTEDVTNYFKLRAPELSINVQNAEQLIAQMKKQMQMFTLLLGAIGSISLIVGGVGVMNVMLVSVTERKKEIGIRRALGALRRDIQVQFIIESLVLCLVGGLIGMGMGVAASYFIAKHNGWDFVVSNIAVIMGVGVSTAVGLFFGYYPARRASMLDPIVALRS